MMNKVDDLIDKLASNSQAVKPARPPALLTLEWIVVSAFYLAVVLTLTGFRPDLVSKMQEAWFTAEIAILSALILVACLTAALLAFPDLHQMRWLSLMPTVVFLLFSLVMFQSWRADTPPTPPPVHSIQCTLSITVFAILPATWILWVMRKYASTHQYWAGGIAALAAFSVGALWLRLHEQTDSIRHVVEWHYIPMMFICLLGMLFGKLILRW